jgi:hypothetical protein
MEQYNYGNLLVTLSKISSKEAFSKSILTWKNYQYFIIIILSSNNNEILFNLDSIKSDFKVSKDTGLPNTNIGVFDLETFIDNDGVGKVYALGFVILGDKPKLYYLNDFSDSSSLVLTCLNDMLSRKYHNYIFYTHN